MKQFDKENVRYLSEKIIPPEKMEIFIRINGQDNFEDVTPDEAKTYDRVAYYLHRMASYGENKWWESENDDILAYYQLKEKTLLVPMERFKSALEILFTRPISFFEMFLHSQELIEEAEKIFNAKNSESNAKNQEKTEEDYEPEFD